MRRPSPHLWLGATIAGWLSLSACATVASGTFVVTGSDGRAYTGAGHDSTWKEAALASAAADIPCHWASVVVVTLSAPSVDAYGEMIPGRATLEGCGQRVAYELESKAQSSSNRCVLTARVPLSAKPAQ
jgi:hypothetical protein